MSSDPKLTVTKSQEAAVYNLLAVAAQARRELADLEEDFFEETVIDLTEAMYRYHEHGDGVELRDSVFDTCEMTDMAVGAAGVFGQTRTLEQAIYALNIEFDL